MEDAGRAGMAIVPTFNGFSSRLRRGTEGAMLAAGRRSGSLFSSGFRTVAGAGLAAATVGLIKNSVTLEASYSKTLRQIKVAADAPRSAIRDLDDLAQQLGRDTIYSTGDAASAMLALAKNGIKPATIEAGALKEALTLGAAGDLPLEQAADTMSNALNAFGLKGKDAVQVSSALAGAANASSASVGDLALALAQSSAVAHDSGLTVQETTAALAEFANAGIRGSDAGTSLKTMLSRLVPQTKKSADEMEKLGLNFTDAHGSFLPLTDVAQQLQDKLKPLSDKERSLALYTIFGSDARRAATILMEKGAKGLEKYIRATSDQTQAEKLAKASMSGTSGELERLRGNVETAEIQLGRGLAPTVKDVTDGLSDMIGSGDFTKWGRDIGDGLHGISDDYGPLAGQLKDLGVELLPAIGDAMGTVRDGLAAAAPYATDMVEAFNDAPEWVKKGTVFAGLAALAGKKIGLFDRKGGQNAASSLLSGSLGSARNPMYVIQVNSKGGVPDGGESKVLSKIPAIVAPFANVASAALGAWAINKYGHIDGQKSGAALAAGGYAGDGGLSLPDRNLNNFGKDDPGKVGLTDWSHWNPFGGSGDKKTIKTAELFAPLVAALDQITHKDRRLLFGVDVDTKDAESKVDRLRTKAGKPIHIGLIVDSIGANVDAAGDALEGFLGGGTGGKSRGNRAPAGRTGAGVTVHGDLVVNAQDVRAAQRDVQRIAQQAGLGGRPPS